MRLLQLDSYDTAATVFNMAPLVVMVSFWYLTGKFQQRKLNFCTYVPVKHVRKIANGANTRTRHYPALRNTFY